MATAPTTFAARASRRVSLLVAVARCLPWRRAFVRGPGDPTHPPVLLWVHRRLPGGWLRYLGRGDLVVHDVALMRALADEGVDFRVVVGDRIGPVANRTIVYSIDAFNPARLVDHSAGLQATLRQLEAQGNVVHPAADEAALWENKVAMHAAFERTGLRSPTTVRLDGRTDIDAATAGAGLTYPLLVKEPHSCNARGVHLVRDREALEALRRRLGASGRHELLLQRLVDMRRDLRVTVIGGEVVHHYWRINAADEWRPTTTRHGSTVDFGSFPERWRATFVEATARLGLRQGAFDVCWEGDDTDGEPLFLEVSPAFSPNPPPTPPFVGRPYADFRACHWGPGSFPAAFVDLVRRQHALRLRAWGLAARDSSEAGTAPVGRAPAYSS